MRPHVVLVMGVAGSGKSTVGRALAARTGWPFLDADTLHSADNVAKMSAGIPLSDEDRWPWLERVAAWIRERRSKGEPGVVACSALKRDYRDLLRKADPDLHIVLLAGEEVLLRRRLEDRPGHFFPRRLLEAQLADLEVPAADENVTVVSIGQSVERVTDSILAALGR